MLHMLHKSEKSTTDDKQRQNYCLRMQLQNIW